ncbi:MAG: helix-turn-helix domain-containing protein [Candidatus Pacebacteria bacterium]|nr:helix-turn-helix domain-containing protein [Candidatus Paceibacterota bacterium]
MQNINTLRGLGLSDNEAKVYLAALELGQATVQELGKKSDVKRTTVYTALEGLKEKGLVSQIKKGAKTFFVAEKPENLLALSERRYKALKEVLPELKSIYNIPGIKPRVKFFEGREGYLAVYENILKEKPKEILAIASYENFVKHIDLTYEEGWTNRRIKSGIKLRWLDFKTERVQEKAIEGEKALREVHYLPSAFLFTSTMFIYSDKIAIVSGKQKEFIAVVIENSEFYQMFKQLFEMLWISHR